MSEATGQRKNKEEVPPPGDDVVPVPPPVTEEPPFDRYCDLVLTGGLASGVVYPWAIVELARAYRFRNIGGTSVGAMAAALAAAAEYGRRTGYEAPFEVLRRAPASLGRELPDGRTRMLSLFQPNPDGERLIRLWGQLGRGNKDRAKNEEPRCQRRDGFWRAVGLVLRAYAPALIFGALVGAMLAKALAWALGQPPAEWSCLSIAFVVLVALLCATLAGVGAVWSDLRFGLIKNDYGLCKGGTIKRQGDDRELTGLSEWLHDAIQASAGLKDNDAPLTFRDLWCAPIYPGAERQSCGPDDPPSRRAINLQMITTNVTHGRPYRLPLEDAASRLFFRRKDLEDYLPARVLKALVDAAQPYAPAPGHKSDPPASKDTEGLLELPAADMPIVVAARLSLSFPLLFSAVPLWAVDYEQPIVAQRKLRRCLFTDGGVSSNFPIHLFDAAIPRWPTFGFWLDRRRPYRDENVDEDVWLPEFNGQGWGDSWNRFDPESRCAATGSESNCVQCPTPPLGGCRSDAQMLWGFLRGMLTSALDWRDRTSFRLPHVRNRVARILLQPDEGGLNIGMPRKQILEMAHRYGTKAGRLFVDRFAELDGRPARSWSEQRWIRFNLLINGLRERFNGLTTSAAWSTDAVPLRRAIERAIRLATEDPEPVEDRGDCNKITTKAAKSLAELLRELERLEAALQATPVAFRSPPVPELRLRPPL
jgi:hypothetical protein